MERIILVVIGVVLLCSPVSAVSWVVFDVDRDFQWGHNPIEGPRQIIYTLDNYQLILDPDSVHTVGGSSAYHWNLGFSGQWAVLGSISSSIFTPDPYASFIQTGMGEGYVSWDSSTPLGHTTSLILGGSFYGDGAATYQEQSTFPADTVTGTLVLHRTFLGGYGNEYELRSGGFSVTYQVVPEPSSLLIFLAGLPGFRVLLRRARES